MSLREQMHRDSVRQALHVKDSLEDLAREQEKALKKQKAEAVKAGKKSRRKKDDEAQLKPAETAASETEEPKESRKDRKRRRKAEKAEEEQPVAYEKTAPPERGAVAERLRGLIPTRVTSDGKEGRV